MEIEIPEYLKKSKYRKEQEEQKVKIAKILILVAVALIIVGGLVFTPYTVTYQKPQYIIPDPCGLEVVTCEGEEGYELGLTKTVAYAHVTGYNTVPEQTDDTPCIAANGTNICGRTDAVACPRAIPLGTMVEIDGKDYECVDRLAPKYDNRYDISCDKDTECPAKVTGYKEVIIK